MSGSNRGGVPRREDENRSIIENPHGVPVTLFANQDVPVEIEAIEQALGFVSLQSTIEETWSAERAGAIAPFWGEAAGRYTDTFARLRVVTPIDPAAADVRLRRDVLARYHDRLREEAPYAYKDITPVVRTVEDAGLAHRVARLWPLLTIKG